MCGRHAFVGLRSPIIVFLGQKSENPKTQVAQVTGQKEIMPRLIQPRHNSTTHASPTYSEM